MNFNTALNINHIIVNDRIKIAIDYMKFWFWLDVIATFPFHLVF